MSVSCRQEGRPNEDQGGGGAGAGGHAEGASSPQLRPLPPCPELALRSENRLGFLPWWLGPSSGPLYLISGIISVSIFSLKTGPSTRPDSILSKLPTCRTLTRIRSQSQSATKQPQQRPWDKQRPALVSPLSHPLGTPTRGLWGVCLQGGGH